MRRIKIVAYIFILLFLFVVCISIWWWFSNRSPRPLTVTFLNVGQGDSVLVQTPDRKQILIDAGPNARVLSELSHVMPIWDKTIDMIIPTHDDADHIGGFPDVLDRYKVSKILMSSTDSDSPIAKEFEEKSIEEGAMIEVAKAGQRFVLDEAGDLVLDILHPPEGTEYEDRNNGSTIVHLVYKDRSFLLTGDAGRGVERMLVASLGEMIQSDVLKVGHHGSRTSTDPVFLETVDPLYAVISAGVNNRYGHPHQEVVDELRRQNITILDTRDGRVKCTTDGELLQCK